MELVVTLRRIMTEVQGGRVHTKEDVGTGGFFRILLYRFYLDSDVRLRLLYDFYGTKRSKHLRSFYQSSDLVTTFETFQIDNKRNERSNLRIPTMLMVFEFRSLYIRQRKDCGQ